MMYSERFEKAKAAGQTKSLTPQWTAFDEPGKSVCGQLLSTSEVPGTLGSGTYLQYLMRSDAGLIKFSLGAATDRELKAILVEGGVYKITYFGQVKIKGGKRVNRFEVEQLEDEAEEVVPAGEVPF